jgi:hypothetical protein
MFGVTVSLPTSGLAGWRFLQRTEAIQQELVSNSPRVTRELEHFDANIAKATTAEALVEDPVLLRVALTAFGLEDQMANKAFLLKVLEEGTEQDDAFANKLADTRFQKFAKAFGYGNIAGPPVKISTFQEGIKEDYLRQSYQIAVGEQDNDLRLALNFVSSIKEIAEESDSDNTGWLDVMGQISLRTVVEKAFGLPSETVALDLDRQSEIFEQKASAILGQADASVFQDPEKVDEVVRRFLLRAQIDAGPIGYSPAATALSILQSFTVKPL